METVSERKLFNLVQFLFNNHVSEEYKSLLMSKYQSRYEIDEIIFELVIDVYKRYYKDKIKLNFYLSFLARTYFNDITLEDLKKAILEKLQSNFECGNMSLEDNHNEVRKALLFICSELNKRNIDYYVFGSIPVYIKLNIPLSRFHSDVDIAVNSRDMEVLKDIFKDSDYEYMDNRLCSQKFFDYEEKRARGGHEIIAKKKNNDFCIGFFEFDRLEDGSITKKDYFSEIVNGNLIHRVCKYCYSKEFTDMYYSLDTIKYEGIEFKYCTVEGTYLLKRKNCSNVGRNKDLYDVLMIENNYDFDEELLDQMRKSIVEAANYKIEEVK